MTPRYFKAKKQGVKPWSLGILTDQASQITGIFVGDPVKEQHSHNHGHSDYETDELKQLLQFGID